MSGSLPLSNRRVYQDSTTVVKAACARFTRSRNEVFQLRQALESYQVSIPRSSNVDAIVGSLGYRKLLLELAQELDISDDFGLRNALHADEQRIAALLVALFDSKADEEVVLRLEGDAAQSFLDVVQNAIDRGFLVSPEDSHRARRIIRKLSEACDRLPSSLFIDGVTGRDAHPTFGGGFSDVYRASYDSTTVALKHMRYFLRGADLRRINLKFCREALVWKDLDHPYILPFIGIDRDSFPTSLCMVSPWMEHGTVLTYLKEHGHSKVDKLLFEIAQGLEYLHSRDIVHGDLRGSNILINEDWSACLSDFGLSSFSNATHSLYTSSRSGSIYWMAPELIAPERFGLRFARTPASDVYAFACVCVELYTGRPPFADATEAAALFAVVNGERPQRPTGPPEMSDRLWKFVTECWSENPKSRPISEVVAQQMTWPVAQQPRLPFPDSTSDTPPPSSNDNTRAPTPLFTATPDGRQSPLVIQKQRQGLWERLKPKLSLFDRGDEAVIAELSHKIDFLSATSCEDWATVLNVCETASANAANAQGAVRILGRIFKDGDPPQQLGGARLWAIMLRNSSSTFITQSTSRKFLAIIADLVGSPQTYPAVRERFWAVVAAAAYASNPKNDPGFLGLWQRIKPFDSPDEGIPFEDTDALLNPTVGRNAGERGWTAEVSTAGPEARRTGLRKVNLLEEDTHHLFLECNDAREYAMLLKDALRSPESLSEQADIIAVFHGKCIELQQFIISQIPWATEGAERSRTERDSAASTVDGTPEATLEEKMLADLLDANEHILEASALYDNVEPRRRRQIAETADAESEPSTAPVEADGKALPNLPHPSPRQERERTVDNGPEPSVDLVERPVSPHEGVTLKARAVLSHAADPEDPDGISVKQGEIVEILDRIGRWWVVQTEDGRSGIVSSDYFTVAVTSDEEARSAPRCKFRAAAQSDWVPTYESSDLPFNGGDIVEILDDGDSWWRARNAKGSVGQVPSNFFVKLQPLNALSSWKAPDGQFSFEKAEVLDVRFVEGRRWCCAVKASGQICRGVPAECFLLAE